MLNENLLFANESAPDPVTRTSNLSMPANLVNDLTNLFGSELNELFRGLLFLSNLIPHVKLGTTVSTLAG